VTPLRTTLPLGTPTPCAKESKRFCNMSRKIRSVDSSNRSDGRGSRDRLFLCWHIQAQVHDSTTIRLAIFEATQMSCEMMSRALEASSHDLRVVCTGVSSEAGTDRNWAIPMWL